MCFAIACRENLRDNPLGRLSTTDLMPDTDLRVHSLLAALGAKIGLPDLAPNEDNVCRIVIDDTVVIDMEHQPGTDNFQAFAVVGGDPGGNVALLRKLLSANLFGQGTGGSVLGLDDQRGEILLTQGFDLSTTTEVAFVAKMESFSDYVRSWLDEVNEELDSASEESAEAEPGDNGGAGGFIRV